MGKSNFELVKQWHETAGDVLPNKPCWPGEKIEKLRIDLIAEEFKELQDAIRDRDFVEVADALGDLLYDEERVVPVPS